ncbi:MAG: N-acetylglucosamine-6-phosphate deacetylase, partial [Limisphaerales bacterium]
MSRGEIAAWHYATRKPVLVRWESGRIISLGKPDVNPPEDIWVAPTIFDVQVNGYGGVDYQQDEITESDLLDSVRQLQRDGCGRILLTLITDEWPKLMSRLARVKAVRDGNDLLRDAIVGWHIEGPFLSDKPGFHGAHNPAFMSDPTRKQIDELRKISGSDPVLLTLAPERPGAIESIRYATSLGIRISLGHTNASVDAIQQAVAAGAVGFTHLGNGCPRELDRHDNILWRVFETPGLVVGIIPDAIHVSPSPFRLMHKLLESIYY